MVEVLLGFNLRKTLKQTNRAWDSNDRAWYLLREDIAIPLSVDEAVWSPCEDAQLLSSLFSDYSPEPNTGPNSLGVYCNIDPTVLYQPSMHDGGFLIGITVVNDNSDRADELITKHYINIVLSIEQLHIAGWECIGYDVANEWLLSGLMNCGYSSSEKAQLINNFATALNEFGLFTSAKDAQNFRNACDTRVPEHAPFAVYGIWVNGRPA